MTGIPKDQQKKHYSEDIYDKKGSNCMCHPNFGVETKRFSQEGKWQGSHLKRLLYNEDRPQQKSGRLLAVFSNHLSFQAFTSSLPLPGYQTIVKSVIQAIHPS